ncbi:hypothetical protein KEM52_006404 [Ascosphaera acerosa]|nr:hypothetical protein KEM52_006404 [Ascosphaera acerosa]
MYMLNGEPVNMSGESLPSFWCKPSMAVYSRTMIRLLEPGDRCAHAPCQRPLDRATSCGCECQAVLYCDQGCAEADWPAHTIHCQELLVRLGLLQWNEGLLSAAIGIDRVDQTLDPWLADQPPQHHYRTHPATKATVFNTQLYAMNLTRFPTRVALEEKLRQDLRMLRLDPDMQCCTDVREAIALDMYALGQQRRCFAFIAATCVDSHFERLVGWPETTAPDAADLLDGPATHGVIEQFDRWRAFRRQSMTIPMLVVFLYLDYIVGVAAVEHVHPDLHTAEMSRSEFVAAHLAREQLATPWARKESIAKAAARLAALLRNMTVANPHFWRRVFSGDPLVMNILQRSPEPWEREIQDANYVFNWAMQEDGCRSCIVGAIIHKVRVVKMMTDELMAETIVDACSDWFKDNRMLIGWKVPSSRKPRQEVQTVPLV